jgi:hypothetical protein
MQKTTSPHIKTSKHRRIISALIEAGVQIPEADKSGSITLNFKGGELKSCETRTVGQI